MPTFISPTDSTPLFYRHYTPSTPKPLTIILLHGWPMSSRMFDPLIPALLSANHPLIAPDRRGFGQSHWSTSTTDTVTFSTFTSDLISLVAHLKPGPFIFLAASMGCAESVLAHEADPYIRQHCKGFIWIGPNMPYGERNPENSEGVDPQTWDFLVEGLKSPGRIGFITEQVPGIFRTDLAGNDIGDAALGFYKGLVAMADPVGVVETVGIMRRDMVRELEGLRGAKVLMLHGDSDAGMPIEGSSMLVRRILPGAELRVYEKGGHGIYHTHAKRVVEDVLGFAGGVLEGMEA
ncbi:hypothetical protein OQA88_1123 [Cercophora sp. LCS_1]